MFIREKTSTFGKAKLVLIDNTFRVESPYPNVLMELLNIPRIKAARLQDSEAVSKDGFIETDAPQELKQNLEFIGNSNADAGSDDDDDMIEVEGTKGTKKMKNVYFKIARDKVQEVKQCALDASYPLMEEYDWR